MEIIELQGISARIVIQYSVKGWFGNYVIKRSTFGLTQRHHGPCIAAIVLFE